ncbi:MAG TPA: DUF5685 family protein [Kineosporiaceae bacterium]|nr:DUF5685 family protein [Kineosporiaceae bacterium]
MFGLVTPCRHALPGALRDAWTAHLCGLCLTLRDRHGQLARTTTNVDAVMVSVLVAAQRPELAATRTAKACLLRGMRPARVVRSDAPAARLAGGVSLVLAGGTLRDHVADGDLPRTARPLAGRVGRRWETRGRAMLGELGLEAERLAGVAQRQAQVESDARAGDLLVVTAPAEAAVSDALAHTAALAARPDNRAALAEAGRMIGRVVHLADALLDQPDDDRHGRWNPLTATRTAPSEAVAVIRRALERTRATVDRLDLPGLAPGAAPDAVVQAELARRLLGRELPRAVHRMLARAGHGGRVCGGRERCGGPVGAEPSLDPGAARPRVSPASPSVSPEGLPPGPIQALSGPEPARGRDGCCNWRRWCDSCDCDCDCCDCCDCCNCGDCCDSCGCSDSCDCGGCCDCSGCDC